MMPAILLYIITDFINCVDCFTLFVRHLIGKNSSPAIFVKFNLGIISFHFANALFTELSNQLTAFSFTSRVTVDRLRILLVDHVYVCECSQYSLLLTAFTKHCCGQSQLPYVSLVARKQCNRDHVRQKGQELAVM